MEADDEKASPNENYGADAVAFASALLRGFDITDEEREALKKNLLLTVAAPAEDITAGVIVTNVPKEKSSAGTDETFYYFSSAPLSQETKPVTPLMVEEED